MRRRLLTAAALGAVILAALFFAWAAPASAHGSYPNTAAFLDAEVLGPHHSVLQGSDLVYIWRVYGIDILDQLVITGAETSMGDPRLGGQLVRENNFGCLRNHGPDKPWAVWSDGVIWIRGKDWYTFPDPTIGMMSWARYIKLGVHGHYPALLEQNNWIAFARIYYGADVPGLGEYTSNLYAIQARYRALARAHGFAW